MCSKNSKSPKNKHTHNNLKPPHLKEYNKNTTTTKNGGWGSYGYNNKTYPPYLLVFDIMIANTFFLNVKTKKKCKFPETTAIRSKKSKGFKKTDPPNMGILIANIYEICKTKKTTKKHPLKFQKIQ